MRTKKTLSALFAILMATVMLLGAMLPAGAELNDPNNVKTIALTLTAPVAGDSVDLSYDSVTCAAPMEYKVVGVDWYKDNATDFMNDRLGRDDNDDHFIGGHNYTVKVTLKTKGDRQWNLDFKQNGDVDYSHITATINGATATLEPHQVSPESTDMLCVCYTFEDIAIGEFTPYVSLGTPVAGLTKNAVTVAPYSERRMSVSGCDWKHRVGGEWVSMNDNDTFVVGREYRLIVTCVPNDGFRFSASGTHTVGDNGYIYGYVNGRQMSMKLAKYGDAFLYDQPITFTYDFVSCEAQELDEVSFGGIAAPVAGQSPSYAVPTMGEATYSLVTDDEITGGAQYGFVNGIAWMQGNGTPLSAQSTFEQGKYYTLSFFIRSDDVHSFAETIVGSANVGYVSVEPIFDDPTLAFVAVEFAPCSGGVMTEINIGGVTEPVTGATPDYDFTYGQGYDKGDANPSIVWVDLTANNKVLTAQDKFEYGHTYELMIIVRSDKAINGDAGEFEFAPIGTLNAKINGKDMGVIMAHPDHPETHYVQLAITFECATATLDNVGVSIKDPLEGEHPAQQITLNEENCYIVESFTIVDDETGMALKPDDVYAGARNYFVTVILSAKNGYRFNAGTIAQINQQQANVIFVDEDEIAFTLILMADELPLYSVSFNDGQSILTKAGLITLPAYEGLLQDDEKFAGWKLADDYSNIPMLFTGEYYIGENTDFDAVLVPKNEHRHVYDNTYTDNGQGQHEKCCVDVENCDDPAGSVIREQHQYGNGGPCDVFCEICGYERTSESEGYPVHKYEFTCSEVCPSCGKQRETTHTPGTAATCTEAQKCTVCSKVLANALGHTAGEAANCGYAQVCTVCNAELAPIQGEHVPGAEATCTEAQKCTVCGTALVPAKGHTAGVEWMQDENGHWHVCAICSGECERAEHTDADGDELCDTCEYDLSTGLPVGAIVAIVIGAVLTLGIGGFAIFWFVIKKKTFADLLAIFKK